MSNVAIGTGASSTQLTWDGNPINFDAKFLITKSSGVTEVVLVGGLQTVSFLGATAVKFVATPKQNYKILGGYRSNSSRPITKTNDNLLEFNLISAQWEWDSSSAPWQGSASFSVMTQYVEPQTPIVLTVEQSILQNINSQNGVLYKGNTLAVAGATIRTGDLLRIKPVTGYKLISGYLRDENGDVFNLTLDSNDLIKTIDFETPITSIVFVAELIPVLTPVYNLTFNDMVSLSGAYADLFINGVKANVLHGTTKPLYEGDVLRLENNTTNWILIPDSCYFTDSNNDNVYFTFNNNKGELTLDSIVLNSFKVKSKNTFPRLTVNQELLDYLSDSKCKLYINNVLAVINNVAYNGDIITIKTNLGYEFNSPPYFRQRSDNDGWDDNVVLTLIDEFKTAFIELDIYGDFYLLGLNIVVTQVDIVTGTNNLYKISNADLKQINIDRFVNSGANPPTIIDYGTNILGVINLPFDINPDYIQAPELIKLGAHETTVTAPKVITDKLYLNLGDISVPMPENSLGFTNATALIHLPYANSLTLDINAVMGQVINVEYVIDLYNGNSYVNIKSNKSDSIIASSSVDLGINIPYSSMLGDNNTVYNSNMSLGGDNHVKTPYIEIIQNIPILGNGFFTAPITAESKLNNELGFIQVDNINLNVTATSNEKDMILTALRNGVIIND